MITGNFECKFSTLPSCSDVEALNRRLHRELRQKDAVIEELRKTVAFLQRRVVDLTGEEIPIKCGMLMIYVFQMFYVNFTSHDPVK